MCTGLEIAALAAAGTGLGAAGSAITSREQQKNAERQAQARNEQLRQTLLKNDRLAKSSREVFDERRRASQPEQMEAQQRDATAERTRTLETAIPATAEAPSATTGANAPRVVRSDMAKRMAEAATASGASAQRLGKLGGYGDSWFRQSLKDTAASRDIGINANFAGGNMATLPYLQDFAEHEAYKPISPIGGILQGAGNMLSGYSGSKAGQKPADPWDGLRTVGKSSRLG